MKISLPARYRVWMKVAAWVVSVSSVVLAFFTLPIEISAPLAIIGFLFPLILERTVFAYRILWLPPMSFVFASRIANCWFLYQTNEGLSPGLGLVFEERREAKETYQVLRSWNYGEYFDSEKNINVTIVRESPTRVSIFIYPGRRLRKQLQIEAEIQESLPSDVEARADLVLKTWIQSSADYADRPDVLEQIDLIAQGRQLLLNTFYVANDRLRQYAKTSLRLGKATVIAREELSDDTLEYHHQWTDPREVCPEALERVKRVGIDIRKPSAD